MEFPNNPFPKINKGLLKEKDTDLFIIFFFICQELQEHMLRLREQLIFCQIGREEAVESERELRTQLLEQGALFHQQEAQLSDLRQRLSEAGYVAVY